jgi:hypothetical protein
MILATSAVAGCSLGLDGLTFDRTPDGGATTGSGGSSSTTGSGGSTTTGSGGKSCAPLGALSDDFGDSQTLSDWKLLSTVDQTPAKHDLLDIDSITPGQLTMRPLPLDKNGWYGNFQGPFLYKEVTGNFLIAARVSAGVLAGPEDAPTRTFNTAGLMARQGGPASANWVLIDVGFQDPTDKDIKYLGLGALAKSTHDGVTTRTPLAGSHQGWLGICRIGDTFGLIRKLDGEASATVLEQVSRPDLGATLQVGMITGSWVAQERDVVGRFDSVHFSVPTTPMDCEACLLE